MKKQPHRQLKPRLDPAGQGYPWPMRGLLTLGKPKEGISYEEWADKLRDYVPQLIQMTLDPDLNGRSERDRAVWAPIHALAILAKLAPVEAVEPLLDVLDWDDDWIDRSLIEFFDAVGPAAVPALQACAQDQSRSRVGRGRAISALGAIASSHDDLRGAVSAFLTSFLDRSQADTIDEETQTAWAIIELSKLKAYDALDAIHCAFNEQRVNTILISLSEVERLMGVASEADEVAGEGSGVTLTLRCKACEREREHTFEKAYFDIGTIMNRAGREHSALIIPERVVCPKCGAVDQYELGTLSHFAVMAKLIAPSTGQPEPLPGLTLIEFTTERWGWMPPRDALARYASEVMAHPSDVQLRVGYGNSLRIMGYRDEAMDQYEQALILDPYAGEARINVAQMKSLHADLPEAIDTWERLKSDFSKLSLPLEERELRRVEIDDTLDELRRGVRPWYRGKPILINERDTPATSTLTQVRPLELAPSDSVESTPPTLVSPQETEYGRVGRNEPCPCGSGKKYKHCHGRK